MSRVAGRDKGRIGGLGGEMVALNPEQRRAVEHFGSPLLILAGAGSGKTRVISAKIGHLVSSGRLDARSVLAVTFTNKAADEMRERTLAMAPEAAGVMIRTFHSFGAWLLRRHAETAGLDPRFRVCDEDDAVSLLGKVVDSLPDDAPPGIRRAWSTAELRAVATRIARAKDFCRGPAEVSDSEVLRWLYRAYDARLRASGAADFGDLIMLPVTLMREHPEIREQLRQRFRAILVDEYQDSNRTQFELLRELVGEGCYLCVVGDDDQSIYKFRGAVVENILSFASVFPGTAVVRLERNYRSRQSILDVASAVVSRNRGRLGKELVAARTGGEPVEARAFEDEHAEARFVADLVGGGDAKSTAVLYRTNHQSRVFESELSRRGIPHRVVGTVRFFDRAEVKDAVAYLAILLNSRDELAFSRVVNHPARGVGRKSQDRIYAARTICGGDLLAAAARVLPDLGRAAQKGLRGFLDIVAGCRRALEELVLPELVERVLEASGLIEYYRGMEGPGGADGEERVENLHELAAMAAGRESGADGLCALLEEAALDSGGEKGEDAAVTLITLHNTKGLEFDRVVITGLEDGIFPLVREGETDLEEERRLFYVGITRARDRLYLTSCRRRRMYGRERELRPSRFLAEIPPELLAGDAAEAAVAAEDGGFAVGCAVFHESYGRGVVVERWSGPAPGSAARVDAADAEEGEGVAVVRFETGRSVRFVLRFSGLEKVAHDDP